MDAIQSLGAIPFGLLIGLARGIDVRKQGSGNIGATNVARNLGMRWGVAALLLAILAGLAIGCGPTASGG